jgi:cathepsin L
MKGLLVFAAVIAVYLALNEFEVQTRFTQWMQTYKKSYHHEEFQHRYRVFKANLAFVESHNAANKSFTVAMNKFGDLTAEEFGQMYRGTTYTFEGEFPAPISSRTDLPVHWDWNSKGAVTPIKNQQQCGSCWSFSTTGSTEGCHFIKRNKLVSLSEQNLMDCSTSYGNNGCDGGLMTQAMDYIIANNGIDTESSYPYTAEDGTCQFNSANVGAHLKSYTNVNSGDENDLQEKVHQGPTSVAIDASHSSFQFYSSGVYNEPACSTSQLDHGVLAVGWGVDSGTDYWTVKNSWGTDWGLNGYIWMSRNAQNQCGIATMATLPNC